jgi:type VI secretion system protein ImpA
MASPPYLDLVALTKPIPGDNPAGPPVPYEIKEKLEEMRREETVDPDAPQRSEAPKKADWSGIRRLAMDILANRSKDLLVAARLTEAMVKTVGFGGLRDGLQLFRELVDNCWDRLNPSIEDGDMEVRAAPFNWLDVADRGARFPTSVRMVPIIFYKDKDQFLRLGWLDWKATQEGRGAVPKDIMEKAIEATTPEASQNALDDLNQCLEHLTKLTTSLSQRMGSVAPGMTGLRPAIEETRFLVAEIVRRKIPPGSVPEPNGSQTTPQPGPGPAPQPSGSRVDVYRQLANAAARLKLLEPHSPIPYLIERAVELGRLSFPELIKALVRDANVLNELNREFGLKQPEEAPPASE